MADNGHLPPQTLMLAEPILVFASASDDRGLELRVNFGILAGREATPAEIDQLAQQLLPKIDRVTIVSEQRYEIGTDAEGTVHQVRVTIEPDQLPDSDDKLAELRGRLLELTEQWARTCFADRHAPINDDLRHLLPKARRHPCSDANENMFGLRRDHNTHSVQEEQHTPNHREGGDAGD
jgi:hypothetical protein